MLNFAKDKENRGFFLFEILRLLNIRKPGNQP
jgi:hypothetical protein